VYLWVLLEAAGANLGRGQKEMATAEEGRGREYKPKDIEWHKRTEQETQSTVAEQKMTDT
tara:strand:+ start:1019 stop:1198 length:180 start_codon:yes stop_codon:yes gene_type:complete